MRSTILPGACLLILAACANPAEPDYDFDPGFNAPAPMAALSGSAVRDGVTVVATSSATVAVQIFQDPTFAEAAPRTVTLGARTVALPVIDRDDLRSHQVRVHADHRALTTFAAVLAAMTESVMTDVTSGRTTTSTPLPSKETVVATDRAFEQYTAVSGETRPDAVLESVMYWAMTQVDADLLALAQDLGANQDFKASLRVTLAELRDIIANGEYPAEFVFVGGDGEEVIVILNSEEEARALEQELEARLEATYDATEDLQLVLQASMERREVALPALRKLMSREEAQRATLTDLS